MLIGEPWMKWTLLEASTKTASKLLQKVIGAASATMGHVFFATFLVGVVQTVTGYSVVRAQRKKLLCDAPGIVGSCGFGFFAVASTVLSFGAFLYGGNVGVNTLIITLSIVPGVFIDKLFFGKRLEWRQWFAVLVFIFAGYFVLGRPSLEEASTFPLWIWMSMANAVTVAINQGITQKVKHVDPMVKNFWGGLTTVALCAIAVLMLAPSTLSQYFSMGKLIFVSLLVGGIVVGMWSFNLLSYKSGAYIALKKLVMNGAYLVSAMLLGVVFFGEEFNAAKGIGVLLYGTAFVFMDTGTWKFVKSMFFSGKAAAV